MDTPGKSSGKTGGGRRYPPPYSAEKYIGLHILIIYARQIAIMSNGEVFTMRGSSKDRETTFAGWVNGWKYCGERQYLNAKTHDPFKEIYFVRYYEKVEYKIRLASLKTQ